MNTAHHSTCIAIGDIHGHVKALRQLLQSLSDTQQIFTKKQILRPHVSITFTGDYIDRGESSLEVIQTIIELQKHNPTQVHTLMGNHELIRQLDCAPLGKRPNRSLGRTRID